MNLYFDTTARRFYIPDVRWIVIILLTISIGCELAPRRGEPARDEMFVPVGMRIHPIFTGIRDWSGDGSADGVEVLLEFQDQFGDPTKASGRVIFELFTYRRAQPDPRGERAVNPWVGSIQTPVEQREHWDRTSRTYRFQLAHPQIDPTRRHVLTAIFERADGGRFFTRTILDPVEQ